MAMMIYCFPTYNNRYVNELLCKNILISWFKYIITWGVLYLIWWRAVSKHTLHFILFLYSFMRLKPYASVAYLLNYCYTQIFSLALHILKEIFLLEVSSISFQVLELIYFPKWPKPYSFVQQKQRYTDSGSYIRVSH